jgi:prepilin-type N-terminal cleavage/methylation domain-containing protein/prepilin-type processing-associated H-X9-DG protein
MNPDLPPLGIIRPASSTKAGFTLVELLTVVAIIGVLASIIIASIGRVRASARSSVCAGNLRQLGVAVQLYAQANRNQLPVAFTAYTEADNNWWYWVSPYAGGKPMARDWGSIQTGSMQDGPFHCPDVTNPDTTTPNVSTNAWVSYKMNDQTRTLAPASSQTRAPGNYFTTPPQGVSFSTLVNPARTILIAEGRVTPRFTTHLGPDQNAATGLWYPHNNRAQILFADGHVSSFDQPTLSTRWSELYPF